MTAPAVDGDRDATMAWLRSLGDAVAADLIQEAVRDAIAEQQLEVVPGLLKLMCCFDPHRAGDLRDLLLAVCKLDGGS